jgi:hypothetical protein
MRSRLLIPLLACGISSSVIAEQASYHLWYDDLGQAVYSQFAPPDGRDSRFVAPPPPPAEPPEQAQARLNEQLQQFEDNREDESLAAEKTAEAASVASQRQRRCDTARSNLKVLSGPPQMLIQTPDGIRRLSEEERQSQRAEMQRIIDTDCK